MKKEKRNIFFKNAEVRSSETEEGKKIIEGIIPYDSKSVPMFGFTEIIGKTAFNKTLKDNTVVRALYNHDTSKVLGSTDSGTLVLENTDKGLLCRCEINDNVSFAKDSWEIVQRGDVKNLSFGFFPIKWQDSENGKVRTLTEVQLLETSFCVPFPAYQETNSIAYTREITENMSNIDIDKLLEVLGKKTLEEDDKLIILETINALTELLKEDAEAKKNEPSTEEQGEPTNQQEASVQKSTSESEKNSERSRMLCLSAEIELLM